MLRTLDGGASAELTSDGQGLRLRHGERLILELRPSEGVLVLAVAEGDLELRAPAGAVRIHSQAVEIAAKHVATTADAIDWSAGTWRLSASQIRQRAESLVTIVQGSIQTRAERIRVVTKGMFQLLSQHTSMRSKDNTAIDGKRVLLG